MTDDALRTQAPERAHALPAHWYVAPAVAALERRAVFDRGWQLVAHASRLAEPGDHVVVDFAGLPVIAVRGADGVIRALHNVCRHRAGPLARCDGRGAKALRCLYHGWTYGLDGRLRSAPDMAGADGFDTDAIRLPALQVRTWRGLVFAAVAPAHDFDALVNGIDARLGATHAIAGHGHHRHAAYEIACDWKAYVDNYLEGYHVPHVHPALNRMLDYRSYATHVARWHSLQCSPLTMPDDGGQDTPYGDGEALYYWLWPNTMLNLLPGRVQTNRVVPLGTGRCRVEFDTYYAGADDAAARARRDADHDFSDLVQHEDVRICEDVQRGLASGSYVAGRLNPSRERGVHHFHDLLRAAYRDADAA